MLDNLPLSFETNKGQANGKVMFLSRSNGYTLFLTPTEACFTLQMPSRERVVASSKIDDQHNRILSPPPSSVLRMQLEGAHTSAMRGEDMLPGKTNYLIGPDPKQWHTDIPTYAKVRCTGVYPGVDLVYYGSQRQLEYDLIVAPKSDPGRITLKFEGAERLTVDRAGDLVVGLKLGSVRWHRPLAYQHIQGRRVPVYSRFILKDRNHVAFAIARYDTRRPLVIDPVFAYSTYFGGSVGTQTGPIVVDRDGNAYVGGRTNFDIPGAVNPPNTDASFIIKLDATGSRLLYSTYIGINVDGRGMAVNGNGELHVVGLAFDTALPVINGCQSTSGGQQDGFLMKINAAGNGLLYSTYLGGSRYDELDAIALGADGTAYVAGESGSMDFPTVAPYQASYHGAGDVIVARIDTTKSGTASLLYSSYLGGSGAEHVGGIAVDSSGRFYVAGSTSSSDFPTVSAFQPMLKSGINAFVCAFSPAGSSLVYSTYLGGMPDREPILLDLAIAVAVDNSRHVFVAGRTKSLNFPVRNAVQSTIGGDIDAFIAEINTGAAGDASLVYSTYLGGPYDEHVSGIGIDVWGNACISGWSFDDNLQQPPESVFVAKIRRGGGSLLFGASFGGSNHSYAAAIAVDPAGNAYVTGGTVSADFPVTPEAFQTHRIGLPNQWDGFVLRMPTFTKLDFNGDATPDLLFQNRDDGRLLYWLLKGNQQTKVEFLDTPNPGANLRVVGSADLNGDGETDFIFQNSSTGALSYWLMTRTHQMASGALAPTNPGANWQVVGVADINRDGYADILFQNSVSGDIYVWFMQGTRLLGGNYLSPMNPGAGWKVAAVGDLNNDGQPDLVFQNAITGSIYVWYLRYGTLNFGGYLNPANPGPGWNVAGLTDINGDGRLEILLQNANTGQLAYWEILGLNVARVGFPNPANPGAPWKLAGLR